MLTVRTVPGAPLETNCYLVADVQAGDAILIDAPKQVVEQMTAYAEELGVTIGQIICTHGHWDHTMGLPELMTATGAPVACHAQDADLLEHPTFAPFNLPFTLTPVTPDRFLAEGDAVVVGSHAFTVYSTPGHTPGSICLYDEKDAMLFSGDTLFAGTCGRVDFPGGNPEQMIQSLQQLRSLPAETRVFPGHGSETTIGKESGWLANVEEMEEY